ncbi:MAG: hypothetical protein IKH01_14505 [Prevotella sp.]|nr:hypothetical protein [Prevotella sp.]
MRTRKEEWGSWTENSLAWNKEKEISLSFKEGTTPEQMVTAAISLAKRYNCNIIKPVEYTYNENKADPHKIAFTVECHRFTYKSFYDGGIGQHYGSDTVTEKDIARYKDRFGTDKCIHKNFKKKFWYSDNWTGKVHEFKTLKKAREAAAKEIGMTVWIYTNYPYGRPSEIISKAKTSEFCPP